MKILNALAIICLISQLSAAIKYCEKGIIGDKKCRDPTLCCSKWGNCGLGAAWCDVSNCVGGACWGTSTTLLTSSSSSTTKSITASTTVQQSSSSVISTNTQQSSSILQTTTAPGPTSTSAPASFVFSPYKDITVNLDWNTFNLRTKVSGTIQSVLSAIPSGMETLTWAFASGECGNELWAGVTPSQIKVNVNLFVNAGKKYIISTGGAAGVFTCGTDAGFLKFIETYYSANMVGVDFDIEGGLTQSQIQSLIQRTKFAQTKYPNLRFSFTVATLGGNSLNSLNYLGNLVVTEIKTSGLSNYYINLMTMDYGPASSSVCVLNASGKCDMGLSAIQAVNNFKNFYGIPYSKIEVTPMIGMNDIVDEIFSLSDAKVLTNFVKLNKLGGLHLWSFDRDTDCILSVAAPYCNSFGQGGVVGFTKTFLSELNFASQSTPSTSPSISPSSTLAPVSTSVASPSNTPSSSISGVSAQQQGAPCGFKSQGTLLQISDSVQICSPPVHCNPETCPPQLGTCVNNVCNYKAGYYGLKTLPQAWATYYCDLSGEGCHGVTQSEFPEITAKRVADAHNLPLCHQKLGGKCVGIAASSPMIVGNSQVATDSNGNFLEYWGLGFSEASDVW
ncbi:hypothetical protein HK099_008596 [Clydaea vesicula]|uniref:Chitinase n=1 Tax=Clydaea vesicula TaxID=447962 RepID=A0AAD5XXV5_9FUNG|nr:hypothetical protein HK099_008596 [Clydaea vesicula]